MRHAAGQSLSAIIGLKWYANQGSEVMRIFEQLGGFLADFHLRYGHKQHGDFQPSNIWYDDTTGSFTLLDVSDIGPQIQSDVEHFSDSIRMFSQAYGPQFETEGLQHFMTGYHRGGLP